MVDRTPIPYSGRRQRQRDLQRHASRETRHYRYERSGNVTYRFNSLGYRGEEHRPDCLERIYVFGCSYTFGIGVNFSELWASVFRDRYCKSKQIPSSQVNLMNFAEDGASNSYIARAVLQQCAVAVPNVAVVQFTFSNRAESFTHEMAQNIGTWLIVDDPEPGELQTQAAHYYHYFSDEIGFFDLVRNTLLVQYHLQTRGIPYIICWIRPEDRYSHLWKHPCFEGLNDLIHWPRFSPFSPIQPDIQVDLAADGRHPGPRSHSDFGDRLIQFFLNVQQE